MPEKFVIYNPERPLVRKILYCVYTACTQCTPSIALRGMSIIYLFLSHDVFLILMLLSARSTELTKWTPNQNPFSRKVSVKKLCSEFTSLTPYIFSPPADVQTSPSLRTLRSTTSTGQKKWRRWSRGCLTRPPELHSDLPRQPTETRPGPWNSPPASRLPVCEECFVQRCHHQVFMSFCRFNSAFSKQLKGSLWKRWTCFCLTNAEIVWFGCSRLDPSWIFRTIIRIPWKTIRTVSDENGTFCKRCWSPTGPQEEKRRSACMMRGGRDGWSNLVSSFYVFKFLLLLRKKKIHLGRVCHC